MWSVGSRAKKIGILLRVISLTSALHFKMWDMHGLVNHNVIDLASQGVIIGRCTTNGGISLSAKGGVIPFDNNRSVKVKES